MEDSLNVWEKREFVYKLGGKYYFLGSWACEECQDPNLIQMYDHFEDVCNCKQFEKEIQDIPNYYKQDVANAFKPIEKECRDRFQTNKTDRALRDRLDERHKEEIERQVARWLKASRCADWVARIS